MNKKVVIGVGVLLLAIVVMVVLRVIDKNASTAAQAQAKTAQGKAGPLVQTVSATSAKLQTTIEAECSFVSPYVVQLSPVKAGIISRLDARPGEQVKAGAPLVVLDTSDARSQIAQAEATLAQNRSRLAQAKLLDNPTSVGVQSSIAQSQATVTSNEANEGQVRANYDAQVQTAQAQLQDAQAKLAQASSAVTNAQAVVEREEATLKDDQLKYERILSLFKQNFVAAQDVDDAQTLTVVQQKTVNVARAQLASAQQGVKSSQAQVDEATQNLGIVKKKGQADITAAGALTAQSKAGLKTARSNTAQTPAYQENLAALAAQVKASEAALAQAKVNLTYYVLRSSIDGTVTARDADPGTLASSGQSVMTIQYLDWLYASCQLPVEDSPLVKAGMDAVITVDGLDGQTFEGQIANLDQAADSTSRQFLVQVKIPNAGHVLKPGMFGHVKLVTHTTFAMVSVPKECVKTNATGAFVNVVDQGKVHVVPVTTGATDGVLVEVLSGLNPGAQVVSVAYDQLKDGQVVRLPGQGNKGAGTAGGKAP